MNNDTSPPLSWRALSQHRHTLASKSLTSLFDDDPERFAQLSLAWITGSRTFPSNG
jgi:hypothetical protein